MDQTSQQPLLVIIRGLPGSGKSYLAAAVAQKFSTDELVQLDPDATDYTSQAYQEFVRRATDEGVDPKLFAYRFLRAQAYAGIETGKIIIWNQPFTNLDIFRKMMAGLENYALEAGVSLQTLVVEVAVDPAVAHARVAARKQAGGHGPSDSKFEQFISDYTTFAGEGYPTIAVNGTDDITLSTDTVFSAIERVRDSQK